MTGTWTIDRIEEGVAALAGDGRVLQIPVELLPAGIREGDVLRFEREDADTGITLRIHRDAEAAVRYRAEAAALLDELRRSDPGGNLSL